MAFRPKRYTVIVADEAYEDLDRIAFFTVTSTESPLIAQHLVDTLESEIEKLCIFPNGFPRYDDEHTYRVRHVKKYCILFDVDDVNRTVYVVRICHSHQNIDDQL